MAQSRSRSHILVALSSLLLATLFWAGNYIVGAAAVASIDPLSLVLLRWAIAVIPLLLIAQFTEHPHWRELIAQWRWLVALSVFGLLGYNLLLYTALEYTDAFDASLVNAFNPALITLAAAMFLKERLTLLSVLGIFLALIGVLIVLSGGSVSTLLSAGFGTGQLLMLAAILAWTAYTIIGRRAPKLPPISSTALQSAITVVILAPLSVARGGVTLPATPQAGWALAFIAIFPSVLSYLLWNRALTVLPAARAGVFLNMLTVYTAVFTILAGHPYQPSQLIGGVVVICGVILTNATSFSRKKGSARNRSGALDESHGGV